MPHIFPEKEFIDPTEINRSLGFKVITHAVSNEKTFWKILKDRKIKIPSENKGVSRKSPFMEKFIGIPDTCYFSAGFDYNSKQHQWPLAFCFDLNIINEKNFKMFKSFIFSRAWGITARYVRDNEYPLLMKVRKLSKAGKQGVDTLLKEDLVLFWKFEKELMWMFNHSKKQNEIIRLIKKRVKSDTLKGKRAISYINKHYFEHFNFITRCIELVSNKSVKLNNHFIGVFVERSRLKKMLPKLRKLVKKNIWIYDGKKVCYDI